MGVVYPVIAALVLLVALLFGARGCADGLREEGREQVRQEWHQADTARISAERQAALARQQDEREKEQRMTRESEENALEAARREQALRDRAADLQRRNDGLRNTIARLDADSRALRAAGTCAAADAEADAAARARSVVTACASEYRSMGTRAAELASQVIGLQDHVAVVQPEAAALREVAP